LQNEKRYFNKGLNADVSFEQIENGQYVNGHNMRYGSTDNGVIDFIQTICGTDEINNIFLPDGKNIGWGGCEDSERNRILFFNYNIEGAHGIYCFDRKAGQVYKVLLNDQVEGGLNFKKYIHSCGVNAGCLYWTEEDANQPRRIHIDACIKTNHPSYTTTAKAYHFPIKQSMIMLIRRPPSMPPVISKHIYDVVFSPVFVSAPPSYATKPVFNNIADKAFYFAWRFNYHTNETSVLSGFSRLSPKNAKTETYDTIKVELPVSEITEDVKTVDIVAKDADTEKCYIVYTWDITKPLFDGVTIYPSYSNAYFFTNHQTGEFIDAASSVKQYDSVPRFAWGMDFGRNRLFLGRFISGYSVPDTNSLKCVFSKTAAGLSTITASYKNFNLSGYYYSSTSGALPTISYTFVLLELLNVSQSGYYKKGTGDIPTTPGPINDSFSNFTFVDSGPGSAQVIAGQQVVFGVFHKIVQQLNAAAPSGYSFVIDPASAMVTDNVDITLTDAVLNNTVVSSDAQYKSGGIYQTGIVFADDYGRKWGVYSKNRIVIPERGFADSTVGGTNILWSLSNINNTEIPVEATNYHIVRTKCLTTTQFVEGKPAANEATGAKTRVIYVKKDASGNITYTDSYPAYDDRDSYIAIDISCLSSYGMGYAYQPNDKIKLFTDTTAAPLIMDIVNQDDKYVWCPIRRLEVAASLSVVTGGSGYTNGTYTGLQAKNVIGEGTGLLVNVTVSGNAVTAVSINKAGIGYAPDDTFYVEGIGGGSGLSLKVNTVTLVTNTLFELYSPHKEQLNEPFYEVSECYKILNPGTASRAYSVLSGTIPGDVYIVTRKGENANFLAESMSPNDLYWKVWNTSASRPNFIDKIGEREVHEIAFSNIYVKGSLVNGLSSFEALNVVPLPGEYGNLRKLKSASKVQANGNVMLVLCSNQTGSIYMGEAELFDTKGSAFVIKTENVLGNINALNGSLGCSHPESVFEHNGFVSWFDKRNACFVRYSNNGLFPISQYGITRVANQLAKDISDEQLIIGGCDPYHKDWLFSIPKTQDVPPKGYLEDYKSMVFPYDVYDGQAKTLVYKNNDDYWGTPFHFSAEVFIRLGKDLYSIYEGKLYLHNTSSNKIYGKPYTSGIAYTCGTFQGPKHYRGIALEADIIPAFTHLRTEDPEKQIYQSSDLVSENYSNKEGVLYAPFFRDRLDVNAGSSYFERMKKGKKLNGKYLLISLTFDKKVQMKASNVNYSINEGHFINQPQS